LDVTDCGAAGNVVAVYGAAEGDRGEEVFVEVFAELAEVGERDSVELEVLVDAKTDGVADDLVCLAKGYALVGEIGGGGHRVQVAGFGRSSHSFRSEGECAGEGREDTEQAGKGVGNIEDLFLTFLKVFVVGEGQALDQGGERGGCSEEAGGFAAG
jgi:hypothetical protein